MNQDTVICKDGFMVDTNTGEVLDRCYELGETEQDKGLKHYSVTPPVPYVPQHVIDKMATKNKWLKGKDHYIKLEFRFAKKLKYLERLCSQSKIS
ncbi:hypothetical protein [Acidianus bottle-shaped virus 3 strain ABV3]|uniref:Uncharacterized protein n=1 Tax=Acidianus bottle-shaped virus 3 strain ABV3 TaxID=1732174 RepID=A0A0N9P4J1_9VIRU|nr:hypothetical protein AVU00_gp20 [Acidianus bottle-shaped virus 3 strain ABV3]ALG96822.1 hypothetical protein [Acidianus bottle-shaped virus 3 strain ABV3]